MQDLTAPGRSAASIAQRVEWLDGVRALAACFVVVHHVWLMSVGGYPGNNGPWFSDWMVYGHLAVSVFIVVSGFSLTLSPARHELRLPEGPGGFLRRRFWRIVPPYWAALAISTALIVTGLIAPPAGGEIGLRDVAVHALLLQDGMGSTPPNGVFWSIAIEWHIYFLFPAVLVLMRRWGAAVVLALAAGGVIAVHLLGGIVPAAAWLDRFSPAYFVLFVAGAAAAHSLSRSGSGSWALWTAASLGGVFVVTAALAGPYLIVAHYFWIDLLVGLAAAGVFAALARGRLGWAASILGSRPLRFVGEFAFSLYLVHAPVLELLRTRVLAPIGVEGGDAFWPLLGLGMPIALGCAYAFFRVCERPFLRIRSLSQFLDALRAFLRPCGRGAVPAARTRGTVR